LAIVASPVALPERIKFQDGEIPGQLLAFSPSSNIILERVQKDISNIAIGVRPIFQEN
jgi:small nuclear ribonucleoprotein (snRNP)-like protein